MHRSTNAFVGLADRAELGDLSAQGELRRQLEPEMVYIVRRVIRTGSGDSSMARRILAEARRLGLDADVAAGADGDLLIRKVARSVSALFVDGLRAKSAGRSPMEETVRN
jgi:hypothetical protein